MFKNIRGIGTENAIVHEKAMIEIEDRSDKHELE